MPNAAVFVATMHQPARIAGSAATSTPLSTTEAVVLFTVMTVLVAIMVWGFVAAMRAQDREIAELYQRAADWPHDDEASTMRPAR